MIISNIFKKSTLITILFVVSITTLIFPFLFFPLLPILLSYGIFYLYKDNLRIKINFETIMVYIIFLIYIWGLSLNQGILYETNINEISNIIFLALLVIILGSISLSQFNRFMDLSINFLSVIVPAVSLFSLLKLYLQTNGVYLDGLYNYEGVYPSGTSLTTDYNMFSFGLIIGLICLMNLYKKSNTIFLQIIILLAVNIVTLSVILSGSRRAYVVLFILVIYFIVVFLMKLKYSNRKFTLIFVLLTLFMFSALLIQNMSEDGSAFYDDFLRVFERYDTIQNTDEGFASRFVRWELAFDIIGDSSLLQILFGQGFSYLDTYKGYFNQSHEDHPHNIVLSTFIYSGLMGVTVFSLFLLFPLLKLIKARKLVSSVPLFIYILFLIYFSISGNTIFHVRIFPIFVIIIYCLSLDKISSQKTILN